MWRGFWDVHHDKNKTNVSLWGWKRYNSFFPPFSCLLHHIKQKKKVKATFDWPLVYSFSLIKDVISPALLCACRPPPPPSSSSLWLQHHGYKSFNPRFTPGITLDRYYVACPCFLRSEMEPASYTTIKTDRPHLTERNNSSHAGRISETTRRMTQMITCCTNNQFHVCYFCATSGQFMKSFVLSALNLNDSNDWVFLIGA